MALADPQSVTVAGNTVSLPRVGSGDGTGVFRSEDGGTQFRVSHSRARRNRTLIRLDSSKLSADPLMPTTNVPVSMSIQLVVDRPIQGFTQAELKEAVLAFAGWLTASSAANTIKVLGGES
ncbi:coat protein [ssRNA phage ESE015]|uniref:Coat protein n=1 Tax=ssRNA phage ESE015 TaxID=2785998 RepID=A0A8S5KXR5_9VIRU|nr:coat protein [ssRNA phage ESE015]DAD49887.1 TPA_asm: coat protein [ssRNA phage ESE015]